MELYEEGKMNPWGSVLRTEVYNGGKMVPGIKAQFRNGDKFALTRDHAIALINAMIVEMDDGIPDGVFELYREQILEKLS